MCSVINWLDNTLSLPPHTCTFHHPFVQTEFVTDRATNFTGDGISRFRRQQNAVDFSATNNLAIDTIQRVVSTSSSTPPSVIHPLQHTASVLWI